MADSRQTAQTTVYIDVDPFDEVQVTSASAYVELEPENEVHVTQVSAYIEWVLAPSGSSYSKTILASPIRMIQRFRRLYSR